MTNEEKFKTLTERTDAFARWYSTVGENPNLQRGIMAQAFRWLEMEVSEEKPLPCPFCGSEKITVLKEAIFGYFLLCDCRYNSKPYATKEAAIAAHNRVAKAVKESGVK